MQNEPCSGESSFGKCFQNVEKLSALKPYPHLQRPQPISFANFNSYRNRRKVAPVFDEFKKCSQKGIIFIWPQRKRFYYQKEMSCFMWMLAHLCYCLHVLNMFPCGSALPLPQPPWIIATPLPKPENRDYIIEPDWDSQFT